MINGIVFSILVGAFSLPLAQGDATQGSNGRLLEAAPTTVHVVYLRTGTIDADEAQKRLPPPTPTARRLLQQLRATPPAQSPEWGPLARCQLWVLTLGPTLHWQEGGQHLVAQPGGGAAAASQKQQQHRHSIRRPGFGEAQSLLRARLHQAGAALVSFLPPAAWLLAVADDADLAPVLEAFPDVRLAPYGPPNMRVSPELAAAVGLVRRAGEAVAERIAAGERLDQLMEEAAADKSGWLLGAMRPHLPTQGSASSVKEAADGYKSGASSDPFGGSSGGGPRSPRRRVQVEVHFPHLELADLAVLAAVNQGQSQEGGDGQGDGDGGSSSRAGRGSRRRQRRSGDMVYHPAAAAAADWLAPLAALSPADCPPLLEPDFSAPELLLVGVCPEALTATVEWLAEAPQVSWLSPRMSVRLHNLASSAILQTGGNWQAARNNASSLYSHPFWAAGLDGRNQTVGCGDSGLDYANCYFYDGDRAVDPSKTGIDVNGMQFFSSESHRKLRYYLAMVQDMSDSFGHGTHVAGTLVGSRYDKSSVTDEPLALGTGQAPAAKIAFLDLSRGNSDGVWTPGDLYRSYFNLTYRVGARVHSDSWGSELTAYDSMSASLDRFTFANQDFVSVFAAGNYGDRSSRSSRGTVTSPAVAKNCIAVGATLSINTGGFGRQPPVPMTSMTVYLDLPGGRFTRSVRVVKAGFGGSFDSLGSAVTPLVVANPENACTGLANAGAVSGKVVLVQRGGCYFTEKARSAAAAGARAVIVYNDAKDSGYFAMSPPSDVPSNSISLPLGSVPLSAGTWLKASVEAGTVSVFFSGVDQSTNYPPYEDIAPYSSVGPTTDGRIKPDIVAPGTLLSANSSRTTPVPGRPGTCDRDTSLVSMSGTSMATPVVAGSALLVRQYFTDGYYPSGARNPSAGFVPSGPLIKAVLLGGAQHMTGVVSDTGMPLEDAPSFRQGFGRLSLLHALPLATSSPLSPGWRLQVVDGAALSEGQHHQFCVTSLGGPLRITLAWYDYPGEQAAARALVNNLDLQVRAAGRGLLLDFGNGAQDVVNTVEKVWYDNLEPGDVAITVVAESIFQKAMKQPYALVVQGNFTGSLPLRGSADPSAASNMCAAQLAVIDSAMSPPPIYNSNNLTFYFGTQDGSTPSGGFECRLVLEADSSSGGWEGCSAPLRNYLRVGDGRYSFQVRVKDSQVAATRSVLVDTVKPVITLASSLPDGADSQGTATDNVTFSFSATDASSAVTFRCIVEFQNGPQGRTTPAFLRFGPGTAAAANDSSGGAVAGGGGSGNRTVPVRQTFSCGSPLELNGMTYGDYALLVSALDAAGNRADANRVNWKIRYSPTTLYARITTGPTGLVATRELRYGVIGFLGSAAATTPPDQLGLASGQQAYEFAAAPLPAAGSGGDGSLQDAAARAGWTQMTNTSVTAAAPSDGSYLVLVRPRQLNTDPITWGVAAVQVDTTPPTVNITRGPKQYQSDPRVTIMYGDDSSSDDVRAFFCRTLNTTSPPPPDPDTPESVSPYSPCSREGATFNTSEGYWLFQVKGRDAAGNVGPPANVSFITDLQPPAITTTLPSVVNVSRLEWSYNLTDTGTGVNNNSCSFRWVALDNATVIDDGSEEFPPADNNPTWRTPCPQPPFRYTLQEGLYMFSVAATDRAGLRSSLDHQVVADFSKPTSRASIGNRRAVPARFTVFVTSRDLPKTVYSGLVRHECKVEAAAAPPPVSPPPPPPSPPPAPASSPPPPFALPPGSRVAAVPSPVAVGGNGGDGGSRRMTQQQQQGGDGSPRLLNGSAIQLGAWHVCDPTGSATNVTYDGFSTGYYTFRVRALDAAGNMGNATEPLFFAVDATLPTDGSETTQVGDGGGGDGASDRFKKIVIGVAVLVGVILLLAAAVAIFVARRRYLRKRYAGSSSAAAAPGLAAPPLPPLQPQRSNGGGVIALQPIPSSYVNGSYANGNGHGYSNGGVNGHAAVGGPTLATVPSVGLPTPPVGSYYYPPVGGGGVLLATPVADPALAAALSASAAEAARARSAAEAAAAAAEEERLRRALELSIEEDNLRRAKEASLAAAQHHTAEQSALEAAIAASLATADQERQRQQQRAAAVQRQVQQQQLHAPPSAPPATSPRAPDYDLI